MSLPFTSDSDFGACWGNELCAAKGNMATGSLGGDIPQLLHVATAFVIAVFTLSQYSLALRRSSVKGVL